MKPARPETTEDLTRRTALGIMVGAGAALTFGCRDRLHERRQPADGDAGASGADGAVGADAEAGAETGSCAVTPEGEIGPYFADDSASGFTRSNVVSNIDGSSTQSGVPLTLTITVVDTKNGCEPYAKAQIDIWHCNASGVYSDIAAESTSSEQWLRGYQLTDASGQVTFTTIIPGWYSGRTTHIHLRIRSTYSDASSTIDGTNTTQLFFAQQLIDSLATSVAPYSAEGTNPTTNATDRVYSDEVDGATLLTLVGDSTNGYAASITIGLPIESNGFDAGGGMGMGGP